MASHIVLLDHLRSSHLGWVHTIAAAMFMWDQPLAWIQSQPSLPATPVEDTPSAPETPAHVSKAGSEDHSGPAAGIATRIDTVHHSSQTPPLLSGNFKGILKAQEQIPVHSTRFEIVTVANENLLVCVWSLGDMRSV